MSHFTTFLIAIVGVAACIFIFEMKKDGVEEESQAAQVTQQSH